MGNVRNCWSLLCLGALIAWTTAAQAQNAAAARPPAPAAEEQGTTLGEVIVTAERRPERIEDVPASITAVSAETIEKAGVVSFLELGSIAPGVQVNQAGGATQPAIRGITSLTNTVGFENNVAVYIDGFYEPDMIAINSDLANVAGIEVLKGPQGTLYGRNATGGAILAKAVDSRPNPEQRQRGADQATVVPGQVGSRSDRKTQRDVGLQLRALRGSARQPVHTARPYPSCRRSGAAVTCDRSSADVLQLRDPEFGAGARAHAQARAEDCDWHPHLLHGLCAPQDGSGF